LAVAFAASCVWLGVRDYNRRERWATWTLAGTIGLPIRMCFDLGLYAAVHKTGGLPTILKIG
jgi:hypothetical protein